MNPRYTKHIATAIEPSTIPAMAAGDRLVEEAEGSIMTVGTGLEVEVVPAGALVLSSVVRAGVTVLSTVVVLPNSLEEVLTGCGTILPALLRKNP
jgi:hypothetical protein